MVLFPKDDRIRIVLERLGKDTAITVDFNTAKQFSRYKQVRQLRKQDLIFIGMDRQKGKSIIYSKKPIQKKGNGFLL